MTPGADSDRSRWSRRDAPSGVRLVADSRESLEPVRGALRLEGTERRAAGSERDNARFTALEGARARAGRLEPDFASPSEAAELRRENARLQAQLGARANQISRGRVRRVSERFASLPPGSPPSAA